MRDREFASFPATAAQIAATGHTLSGYASVFNYPIDSGVPSFAQTTYVRPGAFTKTLKENVDKVKSLFNHGLDPRYGKLPIGRVTDLHQDAHGLWGEVELHDGPDNQNIIAALASGSLNSMSIAFEVTQEAYNDDRSERYIQQAKLFEFGPVTFPANEAATASLHSLGEFVAAVTPAASSEDEQTETPAPGDRESIPDPGRLIWMVHLQESLTMHDERAQELAERFKALGA